MVDMTLTNVVARLTSQIKPTPRVQYGATARVRMIARYLGFGCSSYPTQSRRIL